jgi:hypothetical protein
MGGDRTSAGPNCNTRRDAQERAAARRSCAQKRVEMASLGDLMFALAQWLRTTPLVEFSQWLSNTGLSEFIDRNFWIIPSVQTVHILAIATAFGSVMMINLRIVGLAGRSRTVAQTTARYLPWIWWSLAVLLATGLVMIIGEPVRELLNPCFWIKMLLILLAIGVALLFERSVRHNVARWELMPDRLLALRAGAGGVIVLWFAIMAFGRWIAYAPI